MLSYNYPTLSQAEEAGLTLFNMLTGRQPRDPAVLLQGCYCLVGYGLSLGLPVPHVVAAGMSAEANLIETLQPLTLKQGTALNIDWKTILRLALQFILQNLE
jgi:hypothetical protein